MWIKNLIRHWKKPKEPVFVGVQVPVNQSLEFTNHKLFVGKFFSFLREEYEFSESSSQWVAREYHTQYENGTVTIKLIFEPSMLPHVTISEDIGGASDYTCHDIAELDTEGSFRNIYATRFARLESKNDRYFDKVMNDNIYDRREIEEDYAQWGKFEDETKLRLYANLIKKHPEILMGNFTAFTGNDY